MVLVTFDDFLNVNSAIAVNLLFHLSVIVLKFLTSACDNEKLHGEIFSKILIF